MAWTEVSVVRESFGTEAEQAGATLLVRGRGQRVYYCKSDAPTTCDAALAADDGTTAVAAIGDAFSTARPSATARTQDVKLLSPRQFEVTVGYRDLTGGESEETLLGAPARISSRSQSYMMAYAIDAEGTPVRNAAGEPFDTLPERKTGIRVYTIRKFVTDGTKASIEAALYTNNNAAKSIDGFVCDVDTLFLSDASFEPVQGFHEATITVEYNKFGWTDKPLNVGFTELAAGARKDITQKDAAGEDVPVTKPWPLNADGTKMTDPNGVPEELLFYPYEQDAWAGVPLS